MGVKRKAEEIQEKDDQAHGSTIFVSNLSYSTTQQDLQSAFDDIAPVKTCFIVHQKSAHQDDATSSAASATGPSKGVGYVTFALKEDAESVVERYGEEGKEELKVDGRAIRVKWADRKPAKGEEPPPRTSAPKARPERKTNVSTGPKDPDAIRTILISNLPSEGLTQAALWKKVRKFEGAQKVIWPVGEDLSVAHAIFDTPAHASSAQTRLHAHVFKGATLSVVLKKRSDSLFKARQPKVVADNQEAAPSAAATKSLKPSRSGRLIVRNVPWNITEDDLRAHFTPYGPIYSITIPAPKTSTSSDPESSTPRSLARGFAFIWFLSQPDAARALAGANGSTIYGGYAEDLMFAKKSQIEGKRRIRKKMRDVDGTGGKGSGARKIVVDWALSKEMWNEAQKKAKEEAAANGGAGDGEAMDVDGEVGSKGEDDEDDGEVEAALEDEDEWTSDDGAEGDDTMSLDDDESASSDGETNGPPQPEEGSTLFVRNVPFEATDEDLKTLFRAFGPIRYARVTMDNDTGRSRGTGFVSFWKLEDATTCVEEAERMRVDLDLESTGKKNPFTLLTVDPSSSRAQRLVLFGRTLDVTVAVNRVTADKLRETGERAREKQDKRNLYLMREGVIFPSSPAASSLTKAELERRQQSFQARRTLLRSNPSLYISKTRLSIRNLPTWVSDRGLKRLAIHAKRAFEDDVKAGTRQGLSEDDLAETVDGDDDGAKAAVVAESKKSKKKQKGRATGVKQSKIVRQMERVDPLTGKGRSKGYGFIEMDTHADALRVLRWANNNREVHKLMWGWWRDDELPELVSGAKDQLKALSSAPSAPAATGEGEGEGEKKDDAKQRAEKKDELETRIRKLNARIEEMKAHSHDAEASIKDGRTLHVEFSVENVTVVRRRQDKEANPGSGGKRISDDKSKKRTGKSKNDDADGEEDTRPKKKARTSKQSASDKPSNVEADAPPKKGQLVGGMIGRKRKTKKLAGRK